MKNLVCLAAMVAAALGVTACDSSNPALSPDSGKSSATTMVDDSGDIHVVGNEPAATTEVYAIVCGADNDGDGVPGTPCPGSNAAVDCDDNDAQRSPRLAEVCDGKDNNCDLVSDEKEFDRDLDGYLDAGRCASSIPGSSKPTGDCDDNESIVNPGVTDNTCDGVDQNCSGAADEGYISIDCATGNPGVCAAGTTSCNIGVTVCNQTNAAAANDMTCDGQDNDCSGESDEDYTSIACVVQGQQGVCASSATVCAAGGTTCPQTLFSSPETCNNSDDDCDGAVDDNTVDCTDDGNACNGTRSCNAGTCTNGAAPINGTACADGNVCTTGDSCQNGACSGTTFAACLAGTHCVSNAGAPACSADANGGGNGFTCANCGSGTTCVDSDEDGSNDSCITASALDCVVMDNAGDPIGQEACTLRLTNGAVLTFTCTDTDADGEPACQDARGNVFGDVDDGNALIHMCDDGTACTGSDVDGHAYACFGDGYCHTQPECWFVVDAAAPSSALSCTSIWPDRTPLQQGLDPANLPAEVTGCGATGAGGAIDHVSCGDADTWLVCHSWDAFVPAGAEVLQTAGASVSGDPNCGSWSAGDYILRHMN